MLEIGISADTLILTDKEETAKTLVETYIKHYGLEGWVFAFPKKDVRWSGQCSYLAQEIRLSRTFIAHNHFARITETILHEIAHALTPGHQHDKVWKAKVLELGGTPKANNQTETPFTERGYKWYMVYEGEILGGWRRKPKHDSGYYPQGKPHLVGKTEVVSAEVYDLLY